MAADPLETPYDSMGAADQAVRNWTTTSSGDGGGGGGGGGGDGSGGSGEGTSPFDLPESGPLSGSLDAPRRVGPGEAFSVDATVQNSSSNMAFGGNLVLLINIPGYGNYRLATQQARVAGGESAEATFEIPRGTLPQLEENTDSTLGLIAVGSSDMTGVVTTTGLTITPSSETVEERTGGWSESYFMRELYYGWNLYGQDHDSKGTRYMVAGNTSAGEMVFLQPNGQPDTAPAYFSSIDDVAAALRAYATAVENGEVSTETQPDQSQPRPDASTVTDAVYDDHGGAMGGLASLLGVDPIYAAGGVVLAVIAYWYYKNHYGG